MIKINTNDINNYNTNPITNQERKEKIKTKSADYENKDKDN